MLFGEVARTTTRKERTAAFTLMVGVRQIGLIIGPALNLFLREFDCKVGPFVLNKHTGPGVRLTQIFLYYLRIPIGINDCDLDNFGNTFFILLL